MGATVVVEDQDRKNKLINTMANVEYHPAVLEREHVKLERYTKLPIAKISAFGVAFEPLAVAFQQAMGGNGASGLYWVNTKGGSLVNFADGSGFTGAISQGNNQVGGGMAKLNRLAFNPTMLFMAAALASIDKKLDSIQEAQKEILEFLKEKEKAKLRGNLNFLSDVLNNYKYNWANEKYKNGNHIKVLDIKQDAEQSILFYREQIEKKVTRKSLLHSDKDVKDKLMDIQAEFKEYQLALYLYAFASFLEVMLLGNFDSSYLDGVARKINDYAFRYRELYTQCYDQIESYAKSSIQAQLLSGLANINKVAGEVVAKIPIVSKSQIDETLIETSSRLGDYGSKRAEQAMGALVAHQSSAVHLFVENIDTVNRLYNQPMDLLFDNENIYFGLSE